MTLYLLFVLFFLVLTTLVDSHEDSDFPITLYALTLAWPFLFVEMLLVIS